MKLTIVLLTAAILNVSARGVSQKVHFTGKHVSLESVFAAVEKQTGYVIVYNEPVLSAGKPVSIDVRELPLKQFLDLLFKDQPFGYIIRSKTIVLSLRTAALSGKAASANTDFIPPIAFGGVVVNQRNEPLAGVNVFIKGTKTGTITDEKGTFSLNVEAGSRLVISMIGYESAEIAVNEQLRFVFIMLKISINPLDETVVKGYYSTTKRLNTGSVFTVKSDQIETQPVTDPLLALEGLVPGMFIQQTSGLPGAAVEVRIRGTSSIASGKIPLYIVDGVPFSGERVDNRLSSGYGVGGLTNGGSDPMNLLNPQDIERIEVLKDADATAIYGSRGANGVVLITMKKGKAGKTNLAINANTGGGKVTRMLPTLTNEEYLSIRRKAFANDNITPTEGNAPDLLLWNPNDHTDYQKMLIGHSANASDLSATLSGGNSQTTFLAGGAFHTESTVMPGDSRYKRASVNVKVNHVSTDGKLKADFSTNYSTERNLIYGIDYTASSVTYPNNYPLYRNGQLNWDGNLRNPLAVLNQSYQTFTENLLLNGALSYSLLPNLQVRASAGHNKISLDQKLLYPKAANNPIYNSDALGFYLNNNTTVSILEPQIDYAATIAGGKLSVTGGGTYQSSKFDEPYFVIAAGFASDALLDNYGSADNIFIHKNTSAAYKYVSVYGRLNYALKDKYVLNATFRRDGSSRFGPDKKFGNFGSAGAAWIFSDEAFLEPLHWLSYGKLRGSYGTVGNDQIGDYRYLDTYSSTYSYGSATSYVPTKISNPEFSWERTRKIEIGTEWGFLNNRLQFNAAWFRNRSSNQLVSYPIALQTGFSYYTANLNAVVQNKGLEFELKGTPVDKKQFSWNASFNISAYKNKLVSYPGLLTSTYSNSYVIGQSLNIMKVYHSAGFSGGNALVEDVNHDGVITPGLQANGKGDYIVAGTPDPEFYGGLVNNLRYKHWQMDILFNFVKQKGYAITGFPGQLSNQYREVLNSQFTASTVSSSGSYSSYQTYYVNSDAKITDASFIRLRNLALSYSLPESWKRAVRMSNCKLYVRAQNLITITSYKGFDPEISIVTNPNPSVPPLKMLTAGIQCSF